MSQDALKAIEGQLDRLTADEQQRLVALLVRRLHGATNGTRMGADLAAMAADPDIQREIRAIDREFRETEEDGLEGL